MKEWSLRSWREKPALQQPVYPDAGQLADALEELANLPPLVTPWEVASLKTKLAQAARGESFLLQGGDCAERFADCTASTITNQLKILLQMSLVLVQGSKRPVIRVGRLAGQYAKPRSEDLEIRDGITLPSYRGDIVNQSAFTESGRIPDPQHLLRAYGRSALTLNFIRAMVKTGFADLHHPEYWDLGWVEHSPLADEFHRIAGTINDSLLFMENVLGVHAGEIERVDFYTSHEGLHLSYEEAQTRQADASGRWYNLSTHLPWIGVRTSQVDGAHVEYFRGISNPIGLKIGSAMTADGLRRLLDELLPDNEPGRLSLIHRFGCNRIQECLPKLIDAVRRSGKMVLWCCDPMHGNTRLTSNGIKTRSFGDIMRELEHAFEIHRANGSRLGGVHFELTGDNVTECTGGARGLSEEDLHRAYKSEVDPRLNYEQALELAMLISRTMAAG